MISQSRACVIYQCRASGVSQSRDYRMSDKVHVAGR